MALRSARCDGVGRRLTGLQLPELEPQAQSHHETIGLADGADVVGVHPARPGRVGEPLQRSPRRAPHRERQGPRQEHHR